MKDFFIKILSLSFVSILLVSNVLNLHIYTHQEDDSHCEIDPENNNEDNEDNTCELCRLALNLNNLDYYHPTQFSTENTSPSIITIRGEVIKHKELNVDQLALSNNRNKAPPYQI